MQEELPEFRPVVPSGATAIAITDEDVLDLAALFTVSGEIDRQRHIDKALRTLHSVMSDSHAKGTERVAAAKLTLEACGALGKSTTNNTFVRAETANIQQNDISDNDSAMMKKALSQMGGLLKATDAKISIHEGGQGT